jgi:hypothetical protein
LCVYWKYPVEIRSAGVNRSHNLRDLGLQFKGGLDGMLGLTQTTAGAAEFIHTIP